MAANFHGIGGGGNMAMRTSALAVWSGFNRRLGRGACVPGGEENYAFFELINAGCRVVYTPAAVVRHPSPQNFSELREQHLRMSSDGGAYLAFMLAERPDYRSATVGFILGAIRGKHHLQTGQSTAAKPPVVPRWRQLCAGIRGGLLYAGARLAWRQS